MSHDKEKMIAPNRSFLSLDENEQTLYLVGRRTGIFTRLSDLSDSEFRGHAERALVAHRVTPDNVEKWAAEMMQRFI